MSAIPTTDGMQAETIAALLDGKLRKDLGLEPEDLKIGLTVARNLLNRGHQGEAMRLYAVLVLCQPTEVDFQVGLANCASAMGEHYIALQAASAVIALAPSDPRGYLLSGRSCFHTGSFAEAEQDLGDALGLAEQTGHDVVRREADMLLGRIAAARAAL
ncbi:hypothetical protein ASG43_00035 [Aureimonas sp. Leaf454]|uniref:hypothetical protein n=1 Tax=Aureimonas sp. Leaf454 TaxID=1736381 RepID=UPI0006F606BE|nr:hypothetical protein [Aureimonas sp. Leaf454]KQT54070.1 hypothetical protein ASG43_00035 [Aureimonas sp. Leaf454]